LTAFFAFLIVPPGPPFPEPLHNKTLCGLVACYFGPLEQADAVTRPIRQFGPPLLDGMAPMPFPALNSAFDALAPKGLQNYWKADFVRDLSDEIIEQHVRYGPGIPTIQTAVHIYPVSGAVHRLANDAMAFNYRDANYVHVIAPAYPNSADTPKIRQWVRAYYEALHPYSAGGTYVNFLDNDEGPDRVHDSYRGNFERLRAIKRTYDPTNLFHLNQNIPPAD
jgi:FAD/FMN-containing dehydrogenase